MPTDISNAIGTARQFTPQVQASYQGSYGGVNPTRFQANIAKEEQLSRNIQLLSNALISYKVKHEEYLDKKGLAEAEMMVNGMTPEHIEKLNVIDASQQYGYADSTANPYFTAYADKLRGSFVSSRMKQEFEEYIQTNKPKTVDEMYDVYSKFTEDYRKRFVEENPPTNMVAFDKGYDEKNLGNVIQLTNSFMEEKRKDDLSILKAQLNNKMGEGIQLTTELKKTEGALAEHFKKSFNEARLAGLSLKDLYEVGFNMCKDMVSTGRLTTEEAMQLCNEIILSTEEDGTPISLGSFINKQDVIETEQVYNKTLRPVLEEKRLQELIEKEEEGLDILTEEIKDAMANEPDKVPLLLADYKFIYPIIQSNLKIKNHRAWVEAREKAKESAKLVQRGLETKTLNKIAVEYYSSDVQGDSYDGKSLLDYRKLDSDLRYEVFVSHYSQILSLMEKNPKLACSYMERHCNNPVFEMFKDQFSESMITRLQSLKPNEDGSELLDVNAIQLLKLYKTDPASFERSFGKALSEEVSLMDIAVEIGGLNHYATYNNFKSEDKKKYESEAETYLNKNKVFSGSVRTLDGGSTSGVILPTHMLSSIKKVVAMCNGLGGDPNHYIYKYLNNNYYYTHNSFLPRAWVGKEGVDTFKESLELAVSNKGKGALHNFTYGGGFTLHVTTDRGVSMPIDLFVDIKPAIKEIMTKKEEAEKQRKEQLVDINISTVANEVDTFGTTYSQMQK